jgi:hypothetical protein
MRPNYTDEKFYEVGRMLDERFPLQHPSADDVTDAQCPVARRIAALPVTTLAGLAVKARIAQATCSYCYREENDNDADWDHLHVRKLIDAVLGLAEAAA